MSYVLQIASALNRLEIGYIDYLHAATLVSAHLSSLDSYETRDLWKRCHKVQLLLEDIDVIGSDVEVSNEIEDLRQYLNALIKRNYIILSIPQDLKYTLDYEVLFKVKLSVETKFSFLQENNKTGVFLCLQLKNEDIIFFREFVSFQELEEEVLFLS